MKSRVFTALLVFVTLSQAADLNKVIHEQCADEENLNLEELTKGGVLENASKNIKCFHKCLMEKLGIFKDGQLVEEKILSDISKIPDNQKLKNRFELCKLEEVTEDPCDTAYSYFLCMVKNNS